MIRKNNCVNFKWFAIRFSSGCAYSFLFTFDPKPLRGQLLCQWPRPDESGKRFAILDQLLRLPGRLLSLTYRPVRFEHLTGRRCLDRQQPAAQWTDLESTA